MHRRLRAPSRRGALAFGLLLVLGLAAVVHALVAPRGAGGEPIRVGVLHSLTGPLAMSEQPLVDAVLMAIDEVNDAGGVLGRQVLPVIVDGRSDAETFAREAARLVDEEGVCVLFGCWTSASRKEVKTVVESRDHLLFYPLQYEGMEASPNIVYLGATPNQGVIPGTKWCFEREGRRFFLVGSDYVFPRAANEVIKDYLAYRGGEVVGEAYLPLGSTDVEGVVEAIVAAEPDVVLNTINGDTNLAFFRALREAGIGSDDVRTLSFSLGEEEVRAISPDLLAGDLAIWTYFQSIDSETNRAFVERFKARFGPDRVVNDPMESAYMGVHLWARAAARAASPDPGTVRSAVRQQCLAAPEGMVYVDSENQHTWQMARLGRVCPDGQFEIIWQSQSVIHPLPYPVSRTQLQWDRLLQGLRARWGGHWAAPVVSTGDD